MCDRPANEKGVTCEIEVTPEMISAGTSELTGFDCIECAGEEEATVERIFLAMLEASRISGKNA